MHERLYTVMKRNGRWGVSACSAPLLECDSYQEALEVSMAAASVLAQRQSHARPLCKDDHGEEDSMAAQKLPPLPHLLATLAPDC